MHVDIDVALNSRKKCKYVLLTVSTDCGIITFGFEREGARAPLWLRRARCGQEAALPSAMVATLADMITCLL
jgi:hypothetical protein